MIIRSALNSIHNVDEHTYNGEVIEYWIIFSLKTHWSENKKIIGEFGHAFGIVGKNLPKTLHDDHDDDDVEDLIWKVLDLRCKRNWILSEIWP